MLATRVLPASLAILCLVLLGGARASGNEFGYVPGTEDVPLMPGLVANDGPLVFDQPEGRVVQASAAGPVRRHDVIAFYRDSLPQLGWKPAGMHDFDREGERLDLGFDGNDGNLTVDFNIAPH